MDLGNYADNLSDSYFKRAYDMLNKDGVYAGDSYHHTANVIPELQGMTYDFVQGNYVERGLTFTSLSEVEQDLTRGLRGMTARAMAGDQFFNPMTGLGTLNDPSVFTRANTPIMMGPMEMTNLYAQGGLPSIIIDKKTKGMVAQGVTFKPYDDKFWDSDKIKEMEQAAEFTGCNAILADALRDSFIMGGSIIYPVFKHDSSKSFERRLDKLNLEKGCIDRWLTVDRWNMIFVPSFQITAKDYMNPESIYIPMGGYAVSATRTCILRPKQMPYWALLMNVGWVPSDFCGYIRSIYGYNITTISVPNMAQQMSLLLYQMPLDALNASIGVKGVRDLMKINEEQMREWSILNPKAVNMVGEVFTVNRTFSGFDDFIDTLRSDISAQSGVAQPLLFHTPNKGFSDNTTESLLKDSEMMRLLQREIEPQLTTIKDILIAHCYGMDSEEWTKKDDLLLSFDKPTVTTEKDMAEIGARYSATVASLATAGVPVSEALKIGAQFFKQVTITDETLKIVKKEEDWQHKLEEEGIVNQDKSTIQTGGGGGAGRSKASQGNAASTGAHTKPVKRVKA